MQALGFSEWLTGRKPGDIVRAGVNPKSITDLAGDASRIASYLSRVEGSRIAIVTDDGYHFVAALYAVLSEGKTAVLLGSRKSVLTGRDALFDLALVEEAGGSEKEITLSSLVEKEERKNLNPVKEDAKILLYTSGSTGAPKAILKTVSLLDAEARITTALFGADLAGTTLASCVDPAHLYGLTFAIWMPMALGIPLFGKRLLSQEDFTKLTGPLAVIATPTFLRYLDTKLPPINAKFLLSAGGKLEESAISHAHTAFQCDVSEIYGSTEAGVVGTRRHAIGLAETLWSFCPGVSLKDTANGIVTIRTPLTESGAFTLEDRLAFTDETHFTLLGRLDRIVKIGEERISLDEINSVVKEKLGFSVYAVGVKRGTQCRIGLVVEEAQDHLFVRGAIPKYLESLRGAIPEVAMPRFWRTVTHFPTNDRGKLDRKKMEALFDD